MKRILIIHSSLEIGGAETSLIGLLESLDYSRVSVDLFLMEHSGAMLGLVPKQVNILSERPEYKALVSTIAKAIQTGELPVACARLWGKAIYRIRKLFFRYTDDTYELKKLYHSLALPFLSDFQDEYDMAISYIDPHYIVQHKVHAKCKLGWMHTDFSRIQSVYQYDYPMWENCDYVVHVSEDCRRSFLSTYQELEEKTIVIENTLSSRYVNSQVNQKIDDMDKSGEGRILLSIGRFSDQKNFDNVPDICRRLRESGLNVRWYLIGYGGEEPLIRQRIAEAGMQEHVVILGKKSNPYPYIKACDLYVQPSRYEGKCVTVREAQMLGKPVVITNYATAPSQLEDGVDGVVVPMDNAGCAEGIAQLLRDPQRMDMLSRNCLARDYSNAAEVEKLYKLME